MLSVPNMCNCLCFVFLLIIKHSLARSFLNATIVGQKSTAYCKLSDHLDCIKERAFRAET